MICLPEGRGPPGGSPCARGCRGGGGGGDGGGSAGGGGRVAVRLRRWEAGGRGGTGGGRGDEVGRAGRRGAASGRGRSGRGGAHGGRGAAGTAPSVADGRDTCPPVCRVYFVCRVSRTALGIDFLLCQV